ncbi:unnamed protein product [Phytophthora lilii]|uniref:Unnamed protein product n=1 Tax=Phytophthora lilii TaxID=2077276 RepID=A0A9W6U3M7_9STRA|nr:unnamed protein product [Phytophthora lilii]
MRGDLPWQQASSDAEGAKIKKATSVEELCASLPREWGAMLKNIRECGFEDRPDYDFFEQQLLKLGGKKGLTTPFDWGTRKTSKARVKSIDAGASTKPPAAKAKKAAPEKKKATPRHSKVAAKKKAAAPDPKPKTSKSSETEEDDDVRPQDRAVWLLAAARLILVGASAAGEERGGVQEEEPRAGAVEAAAERGAAGRSDAGGRAAPLPQALRGGESLRVAEAAMELTSVWLRQVEEQTERKKPLRNGGVVKAAISAAVPAPPAPAVFQPAAPPPVVPARVQAVASRNDFNFNDDVWSGPPQAAAFSMPREPTPQAPAFSLPKEPTQQPQPALSDLLSKRSRLPHEDPELFGSDTRPSPSPVHRRNPFQTATERLQVQLATVKRCIRYYGRSLEDLTCFVPQHDRMTGRARNLDDDEPRGGRRKNPRGPPRGVYHPVNQDLLLGGGGDNDNSGYISGSSAVSKKFVSPMNDGSSNKGNKQAAPPVEDENIDPRLKSCDPELIEKIEMEIVDNGDPVTFDDIGTQHAIGCSRALFLQVSTNMSACAL